MKTTILAKSTNKSEIQSHYRRIKSNTVKFNKGFLTHKGSGYNVNFYRNGVLVRNISVQRDSDVYSLVVADF